ncbi:MAG: long-chain fatty acid--CoA ligase [Planctomycetes bacterium]|nr:long-chain fatty acid--CoA ligase [Planctomycetota bacterium]
MPSGLLARSVELFASRPAILEGGRRVTYAELWDTVQASSRALAACGVEPGSVVALQMANSLESVVTLFAARGLGATVLLLDPALTPEDVGRHCERAGARWLLREGAGPEPLGGATPHEGGYAFLVLSSGTAGRPKIVPRTPEQAVAAVRVLHDTVPYLPEDRVFGIPPFFHNYGLYDVLVKTLASGAMLCLERFVPRRAAATVEREGITVLAATPFMYRLMAETRFARRPDFSSVRLAISAGSPLTATVAQAFEQQFGVRIASLYGSTETGPIAITVEKGTFYFSPRKVDCPLFCEPGCVGRPCKGVEVAILDAEGHRQDACATGEAGQVAVRSPANAPCYLDDAEASARVFQRGAVLTGDLGRLDADGRLFLLGRHRPMLDVAGKKVSPAEVEACLREHPAVVSALVRSERAAGGGERLVALVEAAGPVTPLELREHCARHLAGFKVPRDIRLVPSLACGALGKSPIPPPNASEG